MLWRVCGVTMLTGGFGGLLSFAKSRSDDKVAPIRAVRGGTIELPESTLKSHS
jgi:hypothetical protein